LGIFNKINFYKLEENAINLHIIYIGIYPIISKFNIKKDIYGKEVLYSIFVSSILFSHQSLVADENVTINK